MATLGEMVIGRTAEWVLRGRLGPIDQVAETSTQRALETLGIWDAEVLECEFRGYRVRRKGDLTYNGVPIFWDPEAWFWMQLAQGRTEGAFRVIVLKEEEA